MTQMLAESAFDQLNRLPTHIIAILKKKKITSISTKLKVWSADCAFPPVMEDKVVIELRKNFYHLYFDHKSRCTSAMVCTCGVYIYILRIIFLLLLKLQKMRSMQKINRVNNYKLKYMSLQKSEKKWYSVQMNGAKQNTSFRESQPVMTKEKYPLIVALPICRLWTTLDMIPWKQLTNRGQAKSLMIRYPIAIERNIWTLKYCSTLQDTGKCVLTD